MAVSGAKHQYIWRSDPMIMQARDGEWQKLVLNLLRSFSLNMDKCWDTRNIEKRAINHGPSWPGTFPIPSYMFCFLEVCGHLRFVG